MPASRVIGWPPLSNIAVENIIPPFVEVRGTLTLSINATDGVSVIRSALEAAEALSNEAEEIDVKCFYDGAPSYRLELRHRISRSPKRCGKKQPKPLSIT